jgi:hypothetical protein
MHAIPQHTVEAVPQLASLGRVSFLLIWMRCVRFPTTLCTPMPQCHVRGVRIYSGSRPHIQDQDTDPDEIVPLFQHRVNAFDKKLKSLADSISTNSPGGTSQSPTSLAHRPCHPTRYWHRVIGPISNMHAKETSIRISQREKEAEPCSAMCMRIPFL